MELNKIQNVVLTILTLKTVCVIASGKFDSIDLALATLNVFVLVYLLLDRHFKGFE